MKTLPKILKHLGSFFAGRASASQAEQLLSYDGNRIVVVSVNMLLEKNKDGATSLNVDLVALLQKVKEAGHEVFICSDQAAKDNQLLCTLLEQNEFSAQLFHFSPMSKTVLDSMGAASVDEVAVRHRGVDILFDEDPFASFIRPVYGRIFHLNDVSVESILAHLEKPRSYLPAQKPPDGSYYVFPLQHA
jgi:hypothetical protein